MKEYNIPQVEILYQTPWISVRRLSNYSDDPSNTYDFLHEDRCNSSIVALLPYKKSLNNRISFLLRNEFTPAWSTAKLCLSSITGGVDGDEEDYLETVIRELHEEAGILIPENEQNRIEFLGVCKGTKSCDTNYQLFAIDVTGLEQEEPTTDGSYSESISNNQWFKDSDISDVIDKALDPLVYVLLMKAGF